MIPSRGSFTSPADLRKEAGEALCEACERILGADGPAALARATRRSKAWWSRLRSGKGSSCPDWAEMVEKVLPPDLPASQREALRHSHRRAWLLLHDRERLSRRPGGSRLEWDLYQLSSAREVAWRGIRTGEFETARRALRLLETIMIASGPEGLPREQLVILGQCLYGQSLCDGQLGLPDAAIAVAERAVEHLRQAGAPEEEARAVHQLGLALAHGRRYAAAREELQNAQKLYQRLGLRAEQVAARRDAAALLIEMGKPDQAEQELLRVLMDAEGLPPAHRYPTLLKLSAACIGRGDARAARVWWSAAETLFQQVPQPAASLPHACLKEREEIQRLLARPKRRPRE